MIQNLQEHEPHTAQLSDMKGLTGFPARITLENPVVPERTVKIPGIIRKVSSTGITVDLLFPMTIPQTGVKTVLEVISRTSLIQCFTVIQNTDSPQCVHLRLPDELHTIQRRRSPRVEVMLLATLSAQPGCPDCIPAQINNLSAGGAAIQVHRPLTVGSRVILNLTATGLTPAEVTASVIRCAPSPAGSWVAGLAFTGLLPDQEQRLEHYISCLMEHPGSE